MGTTASTFRKHNKHKNKKNKKDRKRRPWRRTSLWTWSLSRMLLPRTLLSPRLWRPKVPPARTTQTDCNQAMTSGTKVEFSFLTSSQINFDIDTTKCHLISL